MGSSEREIAARIVALREARLAAGRVLTEEEFTAIVGPTQRRSRCGEVKGLWRPKCTDRVLALAPSLADEHGRVCHLDVARRIGVSADTVSNAVRYLKAQGEWPYRTSNAASRVA